jgi:hypothetical protein
MKRIAVTMLAAALLSACGGGASNVPSPSSTSLIAAPTAAVTFTLKLPVLDQPASANRGALYVSQATASFVVTLTAQNGTPVSPLQPAAFNAAVTNSGCQSQQVASAARAPQARREPQAASASCHFSIAAPVGPDTFTISTYDAAQTSSTPASPLGNLLSTGSVSTTVVANTTNSVSVALNGVVAQITFNSATLHLAQGSPNTINLGLAAKDAAGYTILGSAVNYAVPIILTDSDSSGATTLSRTTIHNPGESTVTIAYTGAPATSATFTASVGGVTLGTATFTSLAP